MNLNAFLNTQSNQSRSLPIVILYVTEGCNLQCIMCSYRAAVPNELTVNEIEVLAEQLCQFGLRQIVYSGGEPLTRRDLDAICEIFTRRNIRQTLLTNGVLLAKRSDLLRYFSEIIVSLDGATSEIHDSIRGVQSFDQILRGLEKAMRTSNRPTVSFRTVIQKRNFRDIPALVQLAKSIGVDRISFLAADIYSDAFSRGTNRPSEQDLGLVLNEQEIHEFRGIVKEMTETFKSEFESSFIAESPRKLYHIAEYFEAILGLAPFPKNQCNAPMVSAVISSTGEIKPCFFLPAFGNVKTNQVPQLMTSEQARSTRSDVRQFRLERCQTCVCTLHKSPVSALMDSF